MNCNLLCYDKNRPLRIARFTKRTVVRAFTKFSEGDVVRFVLWFETNVYGLF